MLVRPSILFFMPFFLIWCLLTLPSIRLGIAYGAVVVTTMIVTIAPWIVRINGVYDRFVLISPVSWTVFIQGNNRIVATDPDYAGYCIWYTKIPEYAERFEGLTQIEREPVARERLRCSGLVRTKISGGIW